MFQQGLETVTKCLYDLKLAKTVNYELSKHHDLVVGVTASDHLGLNISTSWTFSIGNYNEPPYVCSFKFKSNKILSI